MQSNTGLELSSRLVLRINEPAVTAMGCAERLGFIKPETPKLGGKLLSPKFPAVFISTEKLTAARPELPNVNT